MTPAPPAVPVGTRERIDVGGHLVTTWRAGDSGPVVLLVHGMPTNHLLWHDVVPLLDRQARVIAVDLLGYGWSDAPRAGRVDLAAQAGYLLDLLDVLDVGRAVVMGHDVGGGVAQILAINAPARVAGLGVVNGVCFDAWPVPPVRAGQLARPLIARAPAELVAAAVERAAGLLFTDRDRAARFTPWFAAPWRVRGGPSLLAEHLHAAHPAYTLAVAPFLSRLRMPVEVVWGRQDTQLRPPLAERLARGIPTARLEWAETAGHFVPAEDPRAVAEAARRLLRRLGSDSMTGGADPGA